MAFIPLYDLDPLDRNSTPVVTYGLIAANVLLYVLSLAMPEDSERAFTLAVGLIPAVVMGEASVPDGLPPILTFVTHTFVHGNWMHLLGNMLFLWVLGDNVEDAFGHRNFLIFYLLCGVAGGVAYLLSDPYSAVVLIGASGSIAGVIAAYVMMRPCARVNVLVFVFPLGLPAYFVLGLWALMQVWHIAVQTQNGVGWWAHGGGLIAGALLVLVMRQPGVRLFDCVRPADATPLP